MALIRKRLFSLATEAAFGCLLVVVPAAGQSRLCAFVDHSSSLDLRLRCTSANSERTTLASYLLPLRDDFEVSGFVEADPTLNLYPFVDADARRLACGDADHFSTLDFLRPDSQCVGRNNDGDITFTVAIDDQSRARLLAVLHADPAVYKWSQQKEIATSKLHVEIVMMARNIANPKVKLFPGWRLGEQFMFDGVAMSYRGVMDCQKWHLHDPNRTPFCESLRMKDSTKVVRVGAVVTIRGALVIDCDSNGATDGCFAPSGLEIHPAYSLSVQ